MSTTATRIPTISKTSTVNFYDVLSSDNKTHYPLLVEGPGAVSCGCPAGTTLYDEKGRVIKQAVNCYHRKWAVANLIYVDPEITMRLTKLEIEVREWLQTLSAIDDAADFEAYEELFSEQEAA